MIIEKIRAYLIQRGFQRIQVNVEGIHILYSAKERETKLIVFFDCPLGTEFSEDQYKSIKNQIYEKFSNQTTNAIFMHTILCTDYADKARFIGIDDPDNWIIDSKNLRLVIYENQRDDYLGIKNDIEDLLLKEQMPEYETEPLLRQGNKQLASKPLSKYFTKINTILVIFNIIVFLVFEKIDFNGNTKYLYNRGALYWPAVEYFNQYYRLFTYMFLHAGMDHLVNNMIVLLFIGDNLERAVGKFKYIMIYFGSGVIAGIASMSYNMLKNINAISVGASGAVFGVVGALAYIVAINKGRLENISTRQIILFVLFSLYGGLTSRGVDNAAHIGGLIAGILLAAILYHKQKKKETERG